MKILTAILISSAFGFSANATQLTCSQIGMGANPTFIVDEYNDTSFRNVQITTEKSPFVALVEKTASDLITYEFPLVIQEDRGLLSLSVKTAGIFSRKCKGQQANLFRKDLSGTISAVPYCCK